MRVVLPLAGDTDHCVIAALDATGYRVESYDVSRRDRDYFDLISMLWADAEDFALVEHDVVVAPTTLDELSACPHDWCGFPHLYGIGAGAVLTHSLGCVKFGADLIARNPDAMVRVGVMSDAQHGKRHWCRIDSWLQGVVLPGEGEVKHEHLPPVQHLGEGCSHGCTPNF